jgi:hypothetical protein
MADRFAERRAARLAGDEDLPAELAQPFREALDLRRFADGFSAFEGDEMRE